MNNVSICEVEKRSTFALTGEAEPGSGGDQPVRNILSDRSMSEAEKSLSLHSPKTYSGSKMPKKTQLGSINDLKVSRKHIIIKHNFYLGYLLFNTVPLW